MRKQLANIIRAALFFSFFLGATVCLANDTDIYMGSGQGVEPNILIIFDNSGSMARDVSLGPLAYDPIETYTPTWGHPTYPSDAVYGGYQVCQSYDYSHCEQYGTTCDEYYTDNGHCVQWNSRHTRCLQYQCKTYHCNQWACRTWTTQWNKLYDSVSAVPCPDTQANLTTAGQSNTPCNGVNSFRTGNYMNYLNAGLTDSTNPKIEYTKAVIRSFLDTAKGLKVGLMIFNDSEGGHIVSDVVELTAENKASLKASVSDLRPETWTPLAETLWEAGLYFKGADSYFNSPKKYTSPIQFACQKNYIILITDGNSTQDQNSVLSDNLGSDPDYVSSHYTDNGSDYLDNVAQYLYNTDLISTMDGKQNVTTYTIGFSFDPSEIGDGKYAKDLLDRAATAGGGKFFYAESATALADSFQNIVGSILEKTSMYVAPIVPVNQMERTASQDKIYFALFKPVQNKMWSGNIKKFGIAQNNDSARGIVIGDIIDSTGSKATDDKGEILDSAVSFWGTNADGSKVEMGGVGALMNPSRRNIYTYLSSVSPPSVPSLELTANINSFSTTNGLITASLLGVADDTVKNKVIDYVYGYDAYGAGKPTKRSWILGGFIHSRPAIIHYSNTTVNRTVIFAGANDGMFHAFDDATGAELWAFIPPDLLGKLKDLDTSKPGSFVDGSPKTYVPRDQYGNIPTGSKVIVIFGERRGGRKYYALDVADPDKPKIAWVMDGEDGGGPYSKLGQTWSTPAIGKVKIGGEYKWAAFIGGGYDPNQDLSLPGPDASDTNPMGNVVYAVDVESGSKLWQFYDAATMTYSIPSDMSAVDTDGDELIDRLYVGDMGGRMWRFDTKPGTTWGGSILFDSSPGETSKRKIFYPPDVNLAVRRESSSNVDYEILFFGTGDREHPAATSPVNRLYSVDDFGNNTSPLTENDLYDATTDNLQSTDQDTRNLALTELGTKKGWFIILENAGEKCLAGATLLNSVTYYTTFSPSPPPEGDTDPCFVGEGTARLYALNYMTGNAAMNLDISNDAGGVLGKVDRSTVIGTSIPSGVAICIVKGKITGFVGVGMPGGGSSSSGGGAGGGGWKLTPDDNNPMRPDYWRSIF